MIHVQRGRELGAGAGAGVAGARWRRWSNTLVYRIIYSVFVTANTENRWRTVRTFKAADRHEHGHLDRCTPSGAALAERAERTDRAHRYLRTPAAAHTMFYMCPPAYYPLALPGLFVERTVGGANEGPTCGACLLGSSQSAPPIILGSSLCPRPGYWRCGKLPRCRYAVVYAPKGLSLIESRRVMSVPPQGSALLRECSLHRDRDRCACRPVGA